jgi:hypothetical protein
MTSNPLLLIRESIERLEQLSDFLASEVRANPTMSASLPPEKRISKETLLTISVLLPKLHEVRDAHTQAISAGRYCRHCED